MIQGVYCIRDFKTGFLSPMVDVNDLSAKRNFEHACMRQDSLFFSHPEDYALYKIATFDTDLGKLEPLPVVELIMDAPARKE